MKDLNYYLTLPYTKIVKKDEDGDYVARVSELRGCTAHGSTELEALERLAEVQSIWIQDCLDANQQVPEPAFEEALPSGKWLQRVPRRIHRLLTEMARAEGVSLNQLVTSILSRAVGREESRQLATNFVGEWSGWTEQLLKSSPSFYGGDLEELRRLGFERISLYEIREAEHFVDLQAAVEVGVPAKRRSTKER